MTTQTHEVSQVIVLSESQIPPSYVEDSQPPIKDQMPPDSDVFEVSGMGSPFVPTPFVLIVLNVAAATATQTAAAKAKEDGRGNNMKWQPFMSMFVLNKMCELISSGVRTGKGFKEVHLNTVAKQVFEFCGRK